MNDEARRKLLSEMIHTVSMLMCEAFDEGTKYAYSSILTVGKTIDQKTIPVSVVKTMLEEFDERNSKNNQEVEKLISVLIARKMETL